MISNLKSPVFVQVEITSSCNNKCLYCYNFWRNSEGEISRQNLDVNELQQVAEILGNNGIFFVTVTGGEPFLEKNRLYGFMDALKKRNIRIMINSNATLITEEDAKKLSTYPVEIFLASLISYDSKIHNSIANSKFAFEKAINGIRILRKAGIETAINMVATKLNYQQVYDTGRWVFKHLGVTNFSATPICSSMPSHQYLELDGNQTLDVLRQLISLRDSIGINVDILEVLPTCIFADIENEEIVKIFSKRMCTAGNTTVTIGSEGDVRVCSYDRESYGDILTENFSEIWNRMGKWRDNSFLPHECHSCDVLDSCGGGCRVGAKVKTGNYCDLDTLSKGTIKKRQTEFFSEIKNISMDAVFKFLPNVNFRKEKEGVFLIVANPMHFIITNNDGLEFIKHLSLLTSFVPNEIIASMGINQDAAGNFFAELFNKGFLAKISN
mgnify:FL=1